MEFKMTPDHLDRIRARAKSTDDKWNILLAQDDREVLLAYIDTLMSVNALPATCPSCGASCQRPHE
jgi:hypothetical protein